MEGKCENCGCKSAEDVGGEIARDVVTFVALFANALGLVIAGLILLVECWGSFNFGTGLGAALLVIGVLADVYLLNVVFDDYR